MLDRYDHHDDDRDDRDGIHDLESPTARVNRPAFAETPP